MISIGPFQRIINIVLDPVVASASASQLNLTDVYPSENIKRYRGRITINIPNYTIESKEVIIDLYFAHMSNQIIDHTRVSPMLFSLRFEFNRFTFIMEKDYTLQLRLEKLILVGNQYYITSPIRDTWYPWYDQVYYRDGDNFRINYIQNGQYRDCSGLIEIIPVRREGNVIYIPQRSVVSGRSFNPVVGEEFHDGINEYRIDSVSQSTDNNYDRMFTFYSIRQVQENIHRVIGYGS